MKKSIAFHMRFLSCYHVVGFVVDSIDDPPDQEYHTGACCDGDPGDEADKMSIVEVPHTVIDPGTMVIHFENTLLANPAMMRSGRFEGFACPAVPWQRCLLFHQTCCRGRSRLVPVIVGMAPVLVVKAM
jgi:hypothetical protein